MDVESVVEECAKCHIPFWILRLHKERLERTKETFYCPTGHKLSYPGKSDKEKLDKVTKELRILKIENTELRKAKKVK